MTAPSRLHTPSTHSHRLRVLEGPLRGTLHAIRDHFCIGRSGIADLQLLDDRVSREHAEIRCGPGGTHWLIDLGSSNGTFIQGQRVDRALLSLDTTFRIGQTLFAFEREISAASSDETLVVSYHGAPSRRGTVEYSMVEPARARGELGPRRLEVEGQRIVARYSNGEPYAGNVVEDVASFHALHLRKARHELHDAEDVDRLHELTTRLCLPMRFYSDNRLPRLYVRLSCSMPATLRLPSGEGLAVTMVELGVDGAQIVVHDHRLDRGHTAWLTIDLVTGKRLRTVVFTTQVTWNSSDHVGLSFSGQRSWRNIADAPLQIGRTRRSIPAVRSSTDTTSARFERA